MPEALSFGLFLCMTLQHTACKLGHPFLYIGAEVLIAWILFDRPA